MPSTLSPYLVLCNPPSCKRLQGLVFKKGWGIIQSAMDGLMESSIGSLSSSFSASDSSSSSSADFLDDATSSLNKQTLYQMSSVKAELPIK